MKSIIKILFDRYLNTLRSFSEQFYYNSYDIVLLSIWSDNTFSLKGKSSYDSHKQKKMKFYGDISHELIST